MKIQSIGQGMLVVDKWVSIAFLCFITVLLFVNVVGRYVFNSAIPTSEEFGRLFFIAMTYLGISYSQYCNLHVRIDAVLKLYGNKSDYVVILSDIVVVAYAFFITIISIKYTMFVYTRGATMLSLTLPLFWFYAFIPLGHAFLGVRTLLNVIGRIRALINHTVLDPNPPELAKEGGESI